MADRNTKNMINNSTPSPLQLSQRHLDIIYILFIFGLHLFIFGNFMFPGSLCGDELKETMEAPQSLYLVQKRWGVVIWKSIFEYGYLPYIGITLFSAIAAATCLLHVKLLNFSSMTSRLAYGALYTASPYWLGQFIFTGLADTFALSMFLASLSISILAGKRGTWSFAASAITLILALSIHQTALFYAATLWLAWQVRRQEFNPESRGSILRHVFQAIPVFAAALLLHHFISRIIIHSGMVPADVYNTISAYQNNIFNSWKQILASGSITTMLIFGAASVKSALFVALGISPIIGSCCSYWHLYTLAGSLMVMIAALTILRSKSRPTPAWLSITSLLLLFLFAYAPHILTHGYYSVEPRFYIQAAISTACLGALLTEKLRGHSRRVLLFLTGFLVLKATYTSAAIARGRAWNFERTKTQFAEIKNFAKEYATQNHLQNYKIYLAGNWWPIKRISLKNAHEQAEETFLTGTVQPFAVRYYAAYFGSGPIDHIPYEQLPQEIQAQLVDKPLYPAPGSIFSAQGNIYIKVYQTPTTDEN